jgi:hypothetical protein
MAGRWQQAAAAEVPFLSARPKREFADSAQACGGLDESHCYSGNSLGNSLYTFPAGCILGE